MMTIIQEICARIGLVTGDGLGGVLKNKYSKKIVLPLVGLLLIANTINVGAGIAYKKHTIQKICKDPKIYCSSAFAIIVGGNWNQYTIIPHIELKPEFAMMFVAIIGTSISPYLFLWQTS
jgi:Mn2+/Fe2+ NRAMP family transporter